MRISRPTFLSAKHTFQTYLLGFVLGIVYLLAYVWPLPAAETHPGPTQAVSTPQKSIQPAILRQDSLKAPTAKIDPIDLTSEPDPNQPPLKWVTPSGDKHPNHRNKHPTQSEPIVPNLHKTTHTC